MTKHITQIVCDPGAQNEFAIVHIWYIDNYTTGDWDGISGNETSWYSDTPGTQVEIVAPTVVGGIHVQYAKWKDINNTGETIYADDGCINLGNNSGVIFSTNSTDFQNQIDFDSYITISIGLTSKIVKGY